MMFACFGAGTPQQNEFLQTVVDFLIIAACLFLVIKAMNMAKKRFEKQQAAAAPAAPPPSEVYLKEIRDALVKR